MNCTLDANRAGKYSRIMEKNALTKVTTTTKTNSMKTKKNDFVWYHIYNRSSNCDDKNFLPKSNGEYLSDFMELTEGQSKIKPHKFRQKKTG